MPGSVAKTPFEAFVIRYVHDVVTGEQINIGVVLLCPGRRFLKTRWAPGWGRVKQAFPDADGPTLTRVRKSWERHIERLLTRSPLLVDSKLSRPLEQTLREVFPSDFAQLQLSSGFAGLTADPEETLDHLYVRHVRRYMKKKERAARTEDELWRDFAVHLGPLRQHLVARTLHGAHNEELRLEYSWKNGVWNALQPLSLDLQEPDAIRDKAQRWVGRLVMVRPWEQGTRVSFLVGDPVSPSRALRDAGNDAVAILEDALGDEVDVVREAEAPSVARQIEMDLSGHD